MAKVEILGATRSSYTRVVRMVCEEKGIDYELVEATPYSPEVAAIHPFAKLPVLRHGAFTLCESKAITTYLDREFPGPALMPDDPKDAAVAEQWLSMVNTTIDPILVRTYIYYYIRPKTADGKPDKAAIEAMVPIVRQHISLLDRAVARTGYLAGGQFTLADINLLPMLYVLRLVPESAEAIAASPHLTAYYDRHATRTSFQNTTPPPGPPRFSKPG